jgi:hypothetical protein
MNRDMDDVELATAAVEAADQLISRQMREIVGLHAERDRLKAERDAEEERANAAVAVGAQCRAERDEAVGLLRRIDATDAVRNEDEGLHDEVGAYLRRIDAREAKR